MSLLCVYGFYHIDLLWKGVFDTDEYTVSLIVLPLMSKLNQKSVGLARLVPPWHCLKYNLHYEEVYGGSAGYNAMSD